MSRLGRGQPSRPIIVRPPFVTGAGSGTGTISATAALTASGIKNAAGTGTADATAVLTSAGAKAAAGTATIAATATLTSTGVGAFPGRVAWNIAIDWLGDDDFTDTGDDITNRTLERGSFTAEYGRDQARALSPTSSGRASLEIDNASRDYSPDNAASPLYGNLLPARPLRIQATQDGVTYTLFRGHIDDYEIRPGRSERSVQITGLDPIAMLKGALVSTQLHKGLRTGEAIGKILDAIDWPTADRDLDTGATTIRWWWEEGTDALDALAKLVASEGPGAFVHADPDGKIVFRDRHHRLIRSASTTAQATFTDTDEPTFDDFTYDHGWRDIINAVAITVEERDPSPVSETVWESDEIRSIAASSTITINVQTEAPVISPTATYTTLSGSVSSSITQESGQLLTLELTAGGAAATVTDIVIQGWPVTVQRTYQIRQEDSTSIGRYGRRDFTHDAPWAGVHDGDAIAELIIGARAERLPIITMRLTSGTTDSSLRLTQQLARDLSDRVHVREAETCVDHDFFIEQIHHRAVQAGLVLQTEFGLERAPTQAANVFRFDVTGQGFNDGVFGSVGLDDPALLFRFDVTGQGFNDGVFAT